MMRHRVEKIWYGRSPKLRILLLPFAMLYRGVIWLRRCLFRFRIKKSTRVATPVIVVGNLTVGGVGKTPFVIWLYRWLCSQGFKPGIVSRGYGGKAVQWPQSVDANAQAQQVGDEPVMLANQCQCPIWVGPDRVACAQQLLANSDCDIIISDDGLQHYALARDIEIIIIDGKRRFGNQCCLPAGPLREPVKRIHQADFVVNQGAKPQAQEYGMQLTPRAIYSLLQPQKLLDFSQLVNQTVHAVAGIGHPQRFFNTLRELGAQVIEHAFADHHSFKPSDINFEGSAIIIMTEKDAVKCQSFANARHYVLSVVPSVDVTLESALATRLAHVASLSAG